MALLPFLSCSHAAIEAGVEYLVRTQTNDDDITSSLMSANADCAPPSTAVVKRGLSCDGVEFTGTEFPNYFYLGYNFYRHYFPMMALGRYLERQKSGREGRQVELHASRRIRRLMSGVICFPHRDQKVDNIWQGRKVYGAHWT